VRDERPHHHHPHISQCSTPTQATGRFRQHEKKEDPDLVLVATPFACCLLLTCHWPASFASSRSSSLGYYALPACTHSYPLLHNHKRSQGSSTMMLNGCRSAGSNSSRQLLGRAAAQAAASSPSSLLHPHPTISSSSMASALGSRRHISDKLFIRST
jgi:hypothetical protein